MDHAHVEPPIAAGVTPLDAFALVDAYQAGCQRLVEAAGALANAYDSELARRFPDLGVYRRLLRPDSIEALEKAREVWSKALAEFRASVAVPPGSERFQEPTTQPGRP